MTINPVSYVECMAKKFNDQKMSVAPHCLVRNVSSDVMLGGGDRVHTSNPYWSSTWTHGPSLPWNIRSAQSIHNLGSVLQERGDGTDISDHERGVGGPATKVM